MQNKNLTGYPSIDKPWLKYYSDEAINTPLPECTIYEYICDANKDNHDKTAINYYGTEITYGELFQSISKVAGALESIGIKKGDIVTVCMINSPEAIYLLFALNKIGAVANMIYGVSTEEEIAKYLEDSKSDIVFTLDIFQMKFENIIKHTKINKVIVSTSTQSMSADEKAAMEQAMGLPTMPLPDMSEFISWKSFMKGAKDTDTFCHDSEAPAIITYTGGTTGGSKGVVASNKGFISNIEQYKRMNIKLNRDEKWLLVLPLFIGFGNFAMMIPLSVGMTVILRMPMAEPIAYICRKFKPDHIFYGPAFWEAFADDNEDLDISYFIEPMTGGDTLNPNTEAKINNYFKSHGSKYKIMNGYGMSELGPGISINCKNAYEEGSVGAPFVKTVVAAFDTETGKELKYGESGELCVHTPSIMMEYINNPEETENIIKRHDDGLLWVHTGDYGFISENGFIHLKGRLKRYMLCIANGVQKKVFSLDIEKVLLKNELVEKCAVVPVNDAVINQAPVAYIVLKNTTSKADAEKNLKEYCEKNLHDVYRPKHLIFTDKFPLTKVGKVDYKALEDQAENNS